MHKVIENKHMSENITTTTEVVGKYGEHREKWAGILTVSGLESISGISEGPLTVLDQSMVARTTNAQVLRTESSYASADFLRAAFVMDAVMYGEDRLPQQAFGLMSRTMIGSLSEEYGVNPDNLSFESVRVCRYFDLELGALSLSDAVVLGHSNRITADAAREIFASAVDSFKAREFTQVAA